MNLDVTLPAKNKKKRLRVGDVFKKKKKQRKRKFGKLSHTQKKKKKQ